MAEPAPTTPRTVVHRSPVRSEARTTALFLLKLVIAVVLLRSFVFAPFSIPSPSMLPRLLVGDFLFVTKWNYGYSRYSLPFGLPLIPGRAFGSVPARGDVVVFKAPPLNTDDYIKRVIGLAGDRIQVRGGQVILNGRAIPRQRIADFVVPVSPNFTCRAPFREGDTCRYPQYRETLPEGRQYRVLDQGEVPADTTGVYTVPTGQLFLMGDNRDDSLDSRFPAYPGAGIGFVPVENVVGRAAIGFFSTDGSASWWRPWTWGGATRWNRIGEGF